METQLKDQLSGHTHGAPCGLSRAQLVGSTKLYIWYWYRYGIVIANRYGYLYRAYNSRSINGSKRDQKQFRMQAGSPRRLSQTTQALITLGERKIAMAELK